jgi:hypothetical protein
MDIAENQYFKITDKPVLCHIKTKITFRSGLNLEP